MAKRTVYLLLALGLTISACGNNKQGNATDVSSANCQFVSTKDNSPLSIIAAPSDSDAAKAFLASCINPYTKLYAKDAEAAKQGKKQYAYQGCSGCHGGNANGLMGPSLIDAKWHYAKHISDKGMFETISGGSAGVSGGVMSPWNITLANHVGDGLTTDEILRLIAYIRTEYRGDGEKTWMK
jgi:cytochrome c-L